ncbi:MULTISPECIES: hypothetical protein, partial [unclassified Microcoleus]|uniref:hypothetical protein n=1 Tax=unclassified Microcoleus TaxID=2642155 RepID=UPI002FD771AD
GVRGRSNKRRNTLVSGGLEAKESEIFEAESVVIVAVNHVPSSSPNAPIYPGKCLSRGMPLTAKPVIG